MKEFPKSLAGFYSKNFFRYYGKLQIAWSIIYIISIAGINIFQPMYMKYFTKLLENFSSSSNFMSELVEYGIIALLITFVLSILFTIYSLLDNKIGPKVSNKISEDLCDYVYQQSVSFYTATMPGKIQNQVSLISNNFRKLYSTVCGYMPAILISVIVNFGLVLGINWIVAMILGLGTLFRIVWSIYKRKPISKTSKSKSKASSKLNGKILDSISNFMIIKLFAGAKTEQKIISPDRKDNVEKDIKSKNQLSWFWLVPSFIEDGFIIVVLGVCAFLFSIGQITIADAVFAATAYTIISNSIWEFVYRLPDVLDSYGSASEAYQSLIKPVTVTDVSGARALDVRTGKIEFKNVTFKYARKKVLDDFNLVIKPGEKIGLVGASGAGKTTLVNLLMRFYDPTRGEILIDGQNIHNVTQDSLRENITFIPQEPALFNRTLMDNISYGKPGATLKEVRAAAKRAAADGFIMESAKKYDSLVGDRGIKLSGGQRQRVAIARAFLKDAPILILDEATSALDSETEVVIQKSFDELSRGRTTIAIAHRLSTLRNMDRIIVLDGGHVVESGTHNALLRKKGTYAKLWKMQSGGFIQE